MKRPLFTVCLFLVFGVWLYLSTIRDRLPYPDTLQSGQRVRLTGRVTSQEEDSFQIGSVSILTSGNSIYFSDSSSADDSSASSVSFQNKIVCERGELTVKTGRTYLLEGTFMPFSAATNPGEFDSLAYYRSLGIGGKIKDVVILKAGSSYNPVAEAAYRLRCVMEKRITELLPGEEGEILCALLAGDKTKLGQETKTLYKRNGILHILSISSLHITILGMSLYRLLRKCRVPKPLAAFAGGAVLLFYGMLTGFSLSTCRAIGMYLLRMFAEMVGRTYDVLTALGLLAATMVLYRPYYLENAGFLLSFASVLGIVVFYPVLAEIFQRERPPGEQRGASAFLLKMAVAIGQTILASLSITVFTLPIQLWFYYEIPVYSTLINLFVLPFLAILLISGFLCLLPFCGFLAVIPYCILKYYSLLVRFFDRLPYRNWNPGRISPVSLLLYYGLLFLFLWIRKREKSPLFLKRAALSLPVLGLLLLILLQRKSDRIVFLDVGQGSCTLIFDRSGGTYLFDCGSSSRKKVAEYVLLPALKYYGTSRIDGVFLSHPDSDHTNGFEELLTLTEEKDITIGRLFLPKAGETQSSKLFGSVCEAVEAYAPELPVTCLYAGESLEKGDNYYEILHPDERFEAEDTNEYSLCLYIRMGMYEILLTGDVTGDGEQQLTDRLQHREIGDIFILQAAHHGSKSSTTEALLETLKPRNAVISAGRGNRYNHPHEELLERLKAVCADIYRTDRQGAIEVTFRRRAAHFVWFLRQ